MPLFQPAPQTTAEVEKNAPVDVSPEEVSEMDEAAWYERVYRGDEAPQLTVRAVGMGALLGFLLALTNVYVGLKIGWHLGVTLSACILSFTIWSALHKAKLVKTPMTILENNAMASTASAAGYATGGTLVSAIPALLMISVTPENPGGLPLPWPVTAAWVLLLAILGTSLAIPMKRSMINRERLKFPSGTASAVLLRSLHGHGATAVRQARGLLYAALASGLIPLLKDLEPFKAEEKGKMVRHALLPGAIKIFDWLPGISAAGKTAPLSAWNLKLDYGPALIAAGAIVGLRVTASMLVGALILAFGIGPAALEATWKNPAGMMVTAARAPATAWKDIGVWVGAPMLVSAGLLTFAFQWRTIARSFQGLGGGGSAREDQVEVPFSWFVLFAGVSAAGIIALSARVFAIPVPYGVLAVAMTFVLALVACRSTGETDVTPTGPMGKIMQLTYGILMQQNPTANLMTAGITAGAASASADLLNDLKSGYLLGANPRRQFAAQMMGLIPGTIATVLGYSILVPSARALTGEGGHDPPFPAPAAQQWAAVAKVFQLGIENLHPMAQKAIWAGLVAGVLIALLEQAVPKNKRQWVPSATGLGLGILLPAYQSLGMFLGGAAAAFASRKKGSLAAEMVVPVASGMIAGEAILGVIVAALNNFVLR